MPIRPPQPLTVQVYDRIADIGEALWDSTVTGGDLCHTHRFLRVMEAARVEDSRLWYLLFRRSGQVAGSAVLSAFTVSLDLFVGGAPAAAIRRLRRLAPRFLQIRVLLCGLPLSLGRHNLHVPREEDRAAVVDRLAGEMERLRRTERIAFLAAKEFTSGQTAWADAFCRHGFFRADSIPYMHLPVRWDSFGAMLAAMRHPYRRHVRRSLRKLGVAAPRVDDSAGPGWRWVRGGAEICPADVFYRLYRSVMERAEVKLETLNEAFFHELYRLLGADLELLALMRDAEPAAVAILETRPGALSFLFVGMENPRPSPHDPYFNLLYGIVERAIREKAAKLDLGQTAYWVKQRIGGEAVEEFFYFKAVRPLTHRILYGLRHALFPALRLPSVRVFKTNAEQL